MPVIKRIMCPVDFSDTAAVGAREAASLARNAQAELLLVHVLSEPWLSGSGERGYGAPVAQQYELIARQKLDAAARALTHVAPVRTILVRGAVDEALAQTAVKQSVDLIVMGTRTRRGLARLVTDGMTERVMQQARVPVVRVCPAPREHNRPSFIHGHGTA